MHLTHVVRYWGRGSGARVARVAGGRPFVGGGQREVGRGQDHSVRGRPGVGQGGVVGGQGVVGVVGGRDRGQRLALLQAAHYVGGEVRTGN